MSIRAVIFDFGGVLGRNYDASARNRWIERLGITEQQLMHIIFDSEASALATIGKATVNEIWESAARDLKLEKEAMAQFEEDFWAGDRLNVELAAFLRSLRPRYKTAILSNAWPDARETFTGKFGLGDAVDLMVISAEEGMAKPDPNFYRLVCDRLDVKPEEAVFVDDFDVNVKAAREVGLKAVLFRGNEQTIAEVEGILKEK